MMIIKPDVSHHTTHIGRVGREREREKGSRKRKQTNAGRCEEDLFGGGANLCKEDFSLPL